MTSVSESETATLKPWSLLQRKVKSTTQKAGKCKCSPASRKTHLPSWKYKRVQRKIQKQIEIQQIQVRLIFRIFILPFPFHICELTERGDWKYALGELLPAIDFFEKKLKHRAHPMFLATSIKKIAVNSLKFGIACNISVYIFIICWKTYWMTSTIISQKHRYWQYQPFLAFWVHTFCNLKHRFFCLQCDDQVLTLM